MKIALAFPGCHRKAGVERVVFECARYLADRDHEVTVLAGEWEADAPRTITYRRVDAQIWPAFRRPMRFFGESSRALADMCGNFDALGTFGCVSPLGGVYWAQSVHAAWMEHSRRLRPAMSWGRWKQRLNPIHSRLLRLEQQHLGGRRYQKVIALSAEVRRDLKRFYDVPEEDIEVLPNGFSTEEFNLEKRRLLRADMRQSLGYSDDDRVIIFVANELERKGFGPLMRAVASLEDSRARLLVVGNVVARGYAAEMKALGLADRVKFVGPTREVMNYYAAADVFALPTQYEAWGMVIVEAMACGVPALTSRLAGAAVAVHEGKSGLLLDDPGDVVEIAGKLMKLMEGEHKTQDWIADSVRQYSWPRILGKYEDVLVRQRHEMPAMS